MKKSGTTSQCSIDDAVKGKATSMIGTIITDDLQLMGGEQSKVINLEIENANTKDVIIPFGTPLGLIKEVSFYPSLGAVLTNNGVLPEWYVTATLNKIIDNYGTGAKYLQGLNARLNRSGAYISQIEVITADTNLGKKQRAENIKKIELPLNASSDCIKRGDFISQDIFNTGVELLCTRGVVISDFHGFVYKILAGAKVQMNLTIEAVDKPVYKTY